MPDILITEFMHETAVQRLAEVYETEYNPTLVEQPEHLHALVQNVRALIVRNRTQVCGMLLNSAQKLEVVGRLGVGLDNIDLEICKARNIKVFPATGANDAAVAEYVITAILLLMRGAWNSTDKVLAGFWPRNELIGHEINGKILGLVGYGAIARQVAHRAHALGMSVVAYDPYLDNDAVNLEKVRRVELLNLLHVSDAISLHVPHTEGTKNLIDAQVIDNMKSTAVLINAARGGVLDEQALVKALRDQKLAGAALDVFASEPITEEAVSFFKDTPNLILTPHIAGVTVESNQRVSHLIVDQVLEALEGKSKTR